MLDPNDPANPRGRRVEIIDPETRAPFPNNVIPRERFDPAAVGLLELLPEVGGNGRVRFDRSIGQDFDSFVIRIDHQLSETQKLNVRYFFDDFRNAASFDGRNLLTLAGGSGIRTQNANLGWNVIFSPNLISDVNFTYGRVAASRFQPSEVPSVTDLGVKNIFQPPINCCIDSINVAGFFSVGAFFPAETVRNIWNVKNDWQWIRGRHTFSLGGDYEHAGVYFPNIAKQGGIFRFTNDVTNFALASLMLGKLRNFQQGLGQFVDNRGNFFGLYFEDKIQLHDRFTLTAGIRYEPSIVWDPVGGRVQQFRIPDHLAGMRSEQFPNAPPGLFLPGDPGFPESGTTSDWNNFAPRVGIAWDLTGEGKTVLRAGGGFFYNSRTNGFINGFQATLPPQTPQVIITDPKGPFSDPLRGSGLDPNFIVQPGTADFVFPERTTVATFEPFKKFVTPVMYNWNLTLEHQLARNMLGRIAYVGSHGSHLMNGVELNPATFIPGSKLATDDRRRFDGFASIQQIQQDANSSYNALQLGLVKRSLGRGDGLLDRLTLLANYTFSRSIDDSPFGFTIANATNQGSANNGSQRYPLPITHPDPKALSVGPSQFDHTHRFVVSYVWPLPELRAATNPFVKWVMGGWQMTGIFSAQSGDPLTLASGQDRSRTGLVNVPVFLGSDDDLGTGSRGPGGCGAQEAPCADFLSRDNFAQAPVGEFGNLGKGALRGPDSWTWDMGFFKDFPLNEEARVQFRWEFFNIFNNVNFGNPNTNLNAGGFGGIRSAAPPRIAQVAIKIFF